MYLMSNDEITILNIYNMLNYSRQKDLHEYSRYLLTKQYRNEVLSAIFHNKILNSLFHNLLYTVEKDEFDIEYVGKRIKQIKIIYYELFEDIHHRFSCIIGDLDCNETVRSFGDNSFYSLEQALNSENCNLIRRELTAFYQEYCKIAKKKDTRRIAAV